MSKSDKFEKIIFAASLLVFTLIFAIYKYGLCPDSGGYISMSSMREPCYPLFLFMLRTLFKNFLSFLPEDAYLYAASIVQNLLAAYAVYFAAVNIKKLFKLNNLITALIFLIMLSPFLSAIISSTLRHIGLISISTLIWTEGLTIPLYYIYFTLLIKYILNHELKNYLAAVILSLILALTRGQMLTLFIINFFAMIFACKKFIKPLLVMLALFIITALISRCYYYITQGYFIGNTYGPITSSSGVFLAAGEREADLFEDKDLRELYININSQIDAQGFRANLYNNNILNTGLVAEAAHDPVKFYITGPLIHNYVVNSYKLTGVEAEIARDKLASLMMRKLLTSPSVIKNYIKIYLGYLSAGFIRSVAFVHPGLNIYAVFIYVLALILLAACARKKFKHESLFMLLALVSVIGFVSSVSIVIMPSSRYMSYNLPFLYSAITVCLFKILKN